MPNVMPSQAVQTIDQLFPHAKDGQLNGLLNPGHSPSLTAVINLVAAIPSTLINVPPNDYAALVVAISTIEWHLRIWSVRGNSLGLGMSTIEGTDAVSIIRRVLAECPDEFPPPQTTELMFISDSALRKSIRNDVGAANRALQNSEWKAATVLAGSAIEAMLHWYLSQPSKQSVVTSAIAGRAIKLSDIDRWSLHEFIEVAAGVGAIKPSTATAAKLAQDFRNLIHPGRVARLGQQCDRATAYSAIAAQEHVIRDLS